jgi:hypothetical protein
MDERPDMPTPGCQTNFKVIAHLLEPTHSERFLIILDKHLPTWREARAELNELPMAAEV